MRITALRDTVIRIRVSASQTLPEDASWAVLPEARHSSVAAVPDVQPGFVGFHTRALRVEVSRAGGMLTIRNSAGEIVEQDALPVTYTGTSFRVSKVMPADEHYFGLGDKTGGFDRRNHAFTLWNTDAYRFQESTDPIYKSIPFFLAFRAGSATGTLLDNTWRSSFDFGKESPDAYSFGAVNGPLDYYFFIGPSPRQVVETYAWLTGKPPLPPRWAFGFQQSRYTYTPEQRLLEVASRLRADKIPADALYLDIGFQDKNRSFTIDPQTFPDMSAVLQKLHAMHFHVVAITDLHIAKAAGQNYLPFSSGTASDRFVHNPDGSVYIGSVWPGPSVFPDFTQAATRAWWGTLYKPFAQLGFDGFWNDMNEPSVFNGPQGTMPLDVVHRIDEPGFAPRNASHAEIHNVYGMENSRATHDGLLALEPNLRPFVLTRASFAGGQRYAATWTGDNSSTWNHLRMTTPMLKNLGLSGFSFAGADVGGFAGTATPQLLTKWIEIGAFQPIDRDHSELGTGDQEPWIGGPEQEDIRRRYIEERYRLLPYLYTQAEESAQTGIPMERPLFLDYPDAAKDRHAIDLDPGADAEFLLGHDLLIAPAPYPEAPDAYTVEFPTAEWYDYWTGLRVAAAPASPASPNAPPDVAQLVPLSVRVTPALEKLPVYVRGGSIVPLQPLVQSTDEQPKGPLTLRVYTGDDCTGSLYTDDGRSLAYRNGGSLRMTFACTVDEDGLRLEISRHEGTYVPWWKDIRVEVYGWKPHSSTILLNGRPAAAKLEQRPNSVVFMVPDTGNGETVSLQ
ncbi:MAG TPA: TIM-barrel domain-containing protein [Terracidiphilus sp.]|nr:TIM-barrel domain-containing protein [Terracidiphilus sp.]